MTFKTFTRIALAIVFMIIVLAITFPYDFAWHKYCEMKSKSNPSEYSRCPMCERWNENDKMTQTRIGFMCDGECYDKYSSYVIYEERKDDLCNVDWSKSK